MSSQNCSSETPPNAAVGHISSSTSVPLRQPTRRRDLAVLAASSVSASARWRAAARRPGVGSPGASSRRSPCRARRPGTAGSDSSRTGCGPVKSITMLAPVRSVAGPLADRADPSGSNGSSGCRGCVGPVGPSGSVGARGADGPVRSARGRRRGPAPAGRNPAVRGRVRPGGCPDPGTPGPHAEVEGGRYASQSRDSESRDQDHCVHPECRAWWGVLGALARRTRPMTRAFPRCRERPGTRLIITDCGSPLGTVSHDWKTSALS